jgi:cytoskeletal protein RodZ
MLNNKKLICLYLLIPLIISGCFFNNKNSQPNANQKDKDSKSTWSDKSQNTLEENTTTSTDQNNNTSSSSEKNTDDIIVNGVAQAKPTPEAKDLEIKQKTENDKASDIALKYVSNSKKYLRSSRSLPQVTNIEKQDCSGCFLVSLEYNVIDPQTPGNLIIEFVEVKIEDWKVVSPLDI